MTARGLARDFGRFALSWPATSADAAPEPPSLSRKALLSEGGSGVQVAGQDRAKEEQIEEGVDRHGLKEKPGSRTRGAGVKGERWTSGEMTGGGGSRNRAGVSECGGAIDDG